MTFILKPLKYVWKGIKFVCKRIRNGNCIVVESCLSEEIEEKSVVVSVQKVSESNHNEESPLSNSVEIKINNKRKRNGSITITVTPDV